MLKKLELENVGPAPKMKFAPAAPRLNIITGDNGLGKSFLLESAWWALTRTWSGTPAVPHRPRAAIGYSFDSKTRVSAYTSKWDPAAQEWKRPGGRPPNPGLVIYAGVDGSFSTWDPARNYRLYQRRDGSKAESPPSYVFGPNDVLDGLSRKTTVAGAVREEVLCKGLIDDWTRWQQSQDPRFQLLEAMLKHLGPDEEPLAPGTPIRPTLDDVREIPTIRMPYGQEVPLTYCPAGVRRMSKLAYLLAWTFSEHQAESERIEQPISNQIIVLIDEPETHLHPRWQRTVLGSIQEAVEAWHGELKPEVQLIVATHSPLILASVEPRFDPSRDALWKLDLVDGEVVLEREGVWHGRGDVNRWLVSDVFDLGAPTSREAEKALSRAKALLSSRDGSPEEIQEVDSQLARLLPEMDPFFIRWRHYFGAQLDGDEAR